MRTHHIAVEHGDLPAMAEEETEQNIRGGGLAGAAQTCEPDTEALTMAWQIRFREDGRHFRSREPFRQRTSLAEVLIADLCAGERAHVRVGWKIRRLFVTIAGLVVDELAEGDHGHADLRLVRRHELLRVVGSVEGTPVRVEARAGVIAADDEVIRAVVAPD